MPPRLQPLEKEICQRLAAWRKDARYKQREVALDTGLTREMVAAYEAGRAALSWSVYTRFGWHYGLSPEWLYSGEGTPDASFSLALLKEPFPDGTHFSAAWGEIRQREQPTDQQLDEAAFLRNLGHTGEMLHTLLVECKDRPLMPKTEAMLDQVFEILTARRAKLEREEAGRSKGLDQGEPAREEREKKIHSGIDRKSFKIHPRDVNITVPDWPSLLTRLRGLLAKGSSQAQLARDLQVKPSRVSKWLTERTAPNAESTIQLLRWVQKEEGK